MPLSNRSYRRHQSATDAPPNNKPPFAYGLLHQLRPHKVGHACPLIRKVLIAKLP